MAKKEMINKTLIIITHYPRCYPSLEYEDIRSKEQFDELMGNKFFDDIRPELEWKYLTERDAYLIQDAMNENGFGWNIMFSPSECNEGGEYDGEQEEFEDDEDEAIEKEYLVRLVVHN